MIQPRNTLVLLRLHDTPARQVGNISVPTGSDQFTQAEVIAVGPGNVAAEGGRSDTYDLQPGQLVMVIHKDRTQNRGLNLMGIPVQDDGETLYLYEQARVLGVIAQPGQWTAAPAKSPLILH